MNADFWLRLALASLIIVGVWNAFDKHMIFGEAGDFLNSILPKWVTMPLYDCPMCMASVWGSLVWFGTGGTVMWWIPFVLALSGAMKLVTNIFLNDRHV